MSKNPAERPKTDVQAFIDELGAGVFKERLAIMLTDSALASVVNNKKAKVQVTIDISRLNDAGQVMITSKMKYDRPTKTGSISEDTVQQTVMYVGRGGVLTIEPPKEDLNGQFTLVHSN